MWDWIGKNSSSLMVLVLIIGWVWSVAAMWTRLKDLFKKHEDTVKRQDELEDKFIAHANSSLVHIDPVRDERRMASLERMVQDLHTGLLKGNSRTPRNAGG